MYEQNVPFTDRADAGRQLARKLGRFHGPGTVVLAIPRGGVPVAIEVARALSCELDVVVTRKIPIPGNTEGGYGAVAEDGTIFINRELVNALGLKREQIDRQAREVLEEIKRRSDIYRTCLTLKDLKEKTAIIIDDGLASGFTAVAAVNSVKRRNPAAVVVASPVASSRAYDLIGPECDEIAAVLVSSSYPFAVASFYGNWYDLDDEEVKRYLEGWRGRLMPEDKKGTLRPFTAEEV